VLALSAMTFNAGLRIATPAVKENVYTLRLTFEDPSVSSAATAVLRCRSVVRCLSPPADVAISAVRSLAGLFVAAITSLLLAENWSVPECGEFRQRDR